MANIVAFQYQARAVDLLFNGDKEICQKISEAMFPQSNSVNVCNGHHEELRENINPLVNERQRKCVEQVMRPIDGLQPYIIFG